MATETPAARSANTDEKSEQRGSRKAKDIDVQDLEKRVHLAELRAREAEAELRYIVAVDKRKSFKLENRERSKGKRREKDNRRESQAE
jgi:hypothetical protein